MKFVEVSLEAVEAEEDLLPLKLLVRFRKQYPSLKHLTAADLVWGYSWTEKPLLLDLSKTAEERVNLREKAVMTMVLTCAKDDRHAYSAPLHLVPPFVTEALMDEEIARGADSDWAYHGCEEVDEVEVAAR